MSALALLLVLQAPEEEPWEGSLFASLTLVSGENPYPIGVATIARGAFEGQVRYNYEDEDTISVFAGGRFDFALGALEVEVAPLLGLSFGRARGVLPALLLDAAWGPVRLYVEAELFLDLEESDDDFIYTWEELTFRIADWLQPGLAAQRTRTVDTDTSVDHGLMLAAEFGPFRAGAYAYNLELDREDRYGLVSLEFGF